MFEVSGIIFCFRGKEPFMAKTDLQILLTNDDGAEAPGLLALKDALSALGTVTVVAPYDERSAVSHGVTIHYPLRLIEIGKRHYALTGTPADCVIFAVRKLFSKPPDLVVSGINPGPNLGVDILYSGTVAGAREATLNRIPAIAASLVTYNAHPNFGPAAEFIRRLILKLYPQDMPVGGFLNVNVPEGKPNKGFRFTRQGTKRAISSIEEKSDPRGRTYFWIGRDQSEWIVETDTDYEAVRAGVVSVTPLHRDQTDYRALKAYTESGEAKEGM